MPFGNIFGAFFFLFCAWLGLRYVGAAELSARIAGVLLTLLGLALALGLFTRRSWSRWAGLLAALGMVLVGGWQVDARGTTLDFVVLLAALLTAILLLLRPTAEPARLAAPATQPGGFGRILGWTTTLSALGLVVIAGTTFIGRPPAEPELPPVQLAGLDRNIRWSDFGNGVERARVEGKPLLVTFETTWCGYCKKMDQTTWQHPSVVERLDQMVPVKVNTEDGRSLKGFSGVELAGQYQISGTPTTMLIDPDGRVLARSSGYQDPRQFLSWLEDALVGAGATGAGRLRVSGQ